MPTYYVGPGGNNANNGLTWATRKLTLNGAEDVPVVAGDTVYVAPGVYREQLTCDVSGAAGTPITYIGDVTGEHTDNIGGIVRITGSDNDKTAVRQYCITANSKNYRTFRGFALDSITTNGIYMSGTCANFIVEDCAFDNALVTIYVNQSSGAGHIIRRCVFSSSTYPQIYFNYSAAVDNSNILIENCVFNHAVIGRRPIYITKGGGITIKNCIFNGDGIYVNTLTAGQTTNVNNCLFVSCTVAMAANVLGEITENYNSLYLNGTDRTNVAVGANSNAYPPLFNPPLLLDGFAFPWQFGKLSKWSQVARLNDTGAATDDLNGFTRPATLGKRSWGAIQATGAAREATTVDTGYSIKLPDAGEQFLMRIPCTPVATDISILCYREANYAGTNPQMIIRQPGQADQTITDVGAAGAWNTLTINVTPAADPEWVDVVIRSSNTAAAGNFAAYFDTVTVV